MDYTILIKRFGQQFVALCLELNVCAQGENLAEARQEIASAIKEQLAFTADEQVMPVNLDIETMREFLFGDEENNDNVALDKTFQFVETFATKVPAYAG